MKETLKRDMNKTYLIIMSDEDQYEESYETEMIIKNEPKRILPLTVLRMDGKVQLLYDISSKQTLKSCSERVKLGFQTIQNLFATIKEMENEVRDYLLELESIVLDLDHIYTRDGQFYFCYCPWEKKEVLRSFRELLEDILGNIDYHDTKGVELAYHLYQNACKGSFCIEEILEEHAVREEKVQEEKIQEYQPKISQESESIQKKPGIFIRILKFFLKKEEKKEENSEEVLLKTQDSEEFIYESSENTVYTEVFIPLDRGTEVLGDLHKGQWKLRPLLPEYEEFCVSGDCFIVGKQKGAVDGVIARGTISRIHSRLFVKNEKLFISDANSTNGTCVNGIAVNPGELVEIFEGDRILFADVGYECYNSL